MSCIPPDGWDMSTELEETRARVDEIKGERAAEAKQLSQLIVGISNALVDLGLLPIQDNPQLPKSAHEFLSAASHILERLREVQASDAGKWDRAWASHRVHVFGLSAPPFFCSFFLFPLRATVRYIFTYIYTFIRTLENLCRYTTEPLCLHP
jgi:hypothetical protein